MALSCGPAKARAFPPTLELRGCAEATLDLVTVQVGTPGRGVRGFGKAGRLAQTSPLRARPPEYLFNVAPVSKPAGPPGRAAGKMAVRRCRRRRERSATEPRKPALGPVQAPGWPSGSQLVGNRLARHTPGGGLRGAGRGLGAIEEPWASRIPGAGAAHRR